MAVPERADALNRLTEQTQTGGSQGRPFSFSRVCVAATFFLPRLASEAASSEAAQAEAVLVRAHPVAVDLAAAVRAVAAAVELAAAGRVVAAAVEVPAAVVAAPDVVAAAEVLAAVTPAAELAARCSVVAAEDHRAGRRALSARDVPV
ncbi:MAG: hypothetical protein WBE81_32205, partial [Pseudolabrys sp.]